MDALHSATHILYPAAALVFGFGGGLIFADLYRQAKEAFSPLKKAQRKLERSELMRRSAEVQCERMRKRWLFARNMGQPAYTRK